MAHIFGPEMDSKTQNILESLTTAKEAAAIMLNCAQNEDVITFNEIHGMLDALVLTLQDSASLYTNIYDRITLARRCQSLRGSLDAIYSYQYSDYEKMLNKLEFEFIPILEEAYKDFYYQAYVETYPDREERYFSEEMYKLASNKYIDESMKTGVFKYDLSICVLAYNKIEYTVKCIDALMENLPEDLNYELILWDNGSTDGTVKLFESVKPTKLIESRVNWGSEDIWHRICEGRYFMHVSNDIVVGPNAVKNLLETIKSDDSIGKVVPTTPNVSNLQTIEVQYNSMEEMNRFALGNNVYDPFRHEERTRLCDPIGIWDSIKCFSSQGICPDGYITSTIAFPDDKASLLLRRRGYKQVLSKDAYCHHFGSVTIKDDVSKRNEELFYAENKRIFKAFFKIDPWGKGFCYDRSFIDKVVDEKNGHVDILGINCGMGSNSLRIKEQMKEFCHNTDCTLSNITDEELYYPDLKGISNECILISNAGDFEKYLEKRIFDYIVVESVPDIGIPVDVFLKTVTHHLAEGGKLFIKEDYSMTSWIKSNLKITKRYYKNWISCIR